LLVMPEYPDMVIRYLPISHSFAGNPADGTTRGLVNRIHPRAY